VLGSLVAAGMAKNAGHGELAAILGAVALMFAMINVVGGYFVTDRMLNMFKKKEPKKTGK
jgi:NAD(P) transhydrogenase subunit alpha